MNNIKWKTYNPKTTGKYLTWVQHSHSTLEKSFYFFLTTYDSDNGWHTSPNVTVLCWTHLPDMPKFEVDLVDEKMEEFIDKVDKLCYDYGYEISALTTVEMNSLLVIEGENERVKLKSIIGDGRGKL
jgi:hypothetical protein